MRVGILRAAVAALVLALGIVIGAGPLQEDQDRRARVLAAEREKVAERDAALAQLTRSGRFNDAYAEATATTLLERTLTNRRIALVAFPGVDPGTLASLGRLIDAAGGEMTANVTLPAALASPANRALVNALTSQLATQNPSVPMPVNSSNFSRFGALLARGIAAATPGKAASSAYDATALGIISGFEVAQLVTDVSVTRRADLTLVVLPDSSSEDVVGMAVPFLAAYSDRTATVISAPAAAGEDTGLLGVLRRAGAATLTTTDSLESPSGRICAVLALAARARGVQGHYGAIGSVDGAVPPLS